MLFPHTYSQNGLPSTLPSSLQGACFIKSTSMDPNGSSQASGVNSRILSLSFNLNLVGWGPAGL